MATLKIKQCKGEGQGSCKRCTDNGKWNINWMCFLYEVEGMEGCYCADCVREIKENEQIKEYAETYAKCLVRYGVDVRDKLETATQISLSLECSYMKGRHDAYKELEQPMDELKAYRAIGTVEEFKALKENQRKCEDCANEREHAIDEFANFMHEKAKENNGLRLSSETKSWTHASIFDYVKEFKDKETNSI